MRLYSRRAFRSSRADFAEMYAISDRPGSTYAAVLDALNCHRGKGQQKVTVEHIHGFPLHAALT
jgi:hypothetical protein